MENLATNWVIGCIGCLPTRLCCSLGPHPAWNGVGSPLCLCHNNVILMSYYFKAMLKSNTMLTQELPGCWDDQWFEGLPILGIVLEPTLLCPDCICIVVQAVLIVHRAVQAGEVNAFNS